MSSSSTLTTDEVARVVILGGSITALAVAREAHALGLAPVVVDPAPGIAHRSSLVEVARFADGSDDDVLDRLRDLAGPGACLIATADRWVRFIRRNREQLEALFHPVLHPGNDVLDVCLSKPAFADWCVANRLDTPRHCRGDDPRCLEGIRYPVLVRPAETVHGQNRSPLRLPKAAEAASPQELESLMQRYREAGAATFVAESLLGQRLIQYSVPFARRDRQIISYVARKVRPPADWCSTGTLVELSPDAEIEALALRAIEALDYFGIGEVEVLHSLDSRRSYLIEINARPWVQYSLATESGHGFLGFMLGAPRPAGFPPVKQGLAWINFGDDSYVCFSRSEGIVTKGRLSPLEYLKSVARPKTYALFSWRDPGPWLASSVEWLRSLANR